MGQYYRPILGDSQGLNCKVFDRSVDGQYTFAKLLEHSWWENPFVNAFSELIYDEPSRVAWVGDYADEPDDFDFPNCSAVHDVLEKVNASLTLHGLASVFYILDNKRYQS